MSEQNTEMARRRVTVEMLVTVELLVNDTVVSDWKGYTLRGAFADAERWEPDCPEEVKWLGLAEAIGVDNRRMSSVDGWADFPDEAVTGGWPEYRIEHVSEVPAP